MMIFFFLFCSVVVVTIDDSSFHLLPNDRASHEKIVRQHSLPSTSSESPQGFYLDSSALAKHIAAPFQPLSTVAIADVFAPSIKRSALHRARGY